MDIEASVVHKELLKIGMTAQNVDEWQSLLSPPSQYPWPKGLTNVDLKTEAGRKTHSRVFVLILDKFGISPDQMTGRFVGGRMIHAAAASGFLHIIRLLVEKKADAAAMDSHGSTPLIEAVQAGRIDIVEYLTALGAGNCRV